MRVSLSNLPAASKTYVMDFPKLTGGLNLWELDYRLDPNQSPNMKNLWWQDGVLQCRDGQVFISRDTSLGEGFTCYGTLFHGKVFFHIGDGIYCGDPEAEKFQLTSLVGGVPENRGTFFRYLDWLFYKNKGGFYRIEYDPPDSDELFECKSMVDLAYTPVIMLNADPAYGSGDTYQPENRLSPWKTVRYNAVKDVKTYMLPVDGVEEVKVKVDGTELTSGFTLSDKGDAVTFTAAPPVTTPATNNTVEITYRKANTDAFNSIMDCEYAMVAGGDAHLCILLAGCGAQPNAVYWNDRDNLSMNPGYFPMTYYNLVGDTMDPVTGFGRQYSDIIVLKEHAVGKLTFGVETENLDDRYGISFTYTNINNKVGCDLPWSIQLVENNLVFCNTYQGVQMLRSSSAAYENNVECISRNVNGNDERGLLADVRRGGIVTSFDDDDRYWLCANGHVYLWDYVLSSYSEPSWFFFTNVNGIAYFQDDDHNKYHLDTMGRVTRFDRVFVDYDGPIEKVYQFPTLNFGSYDRLKDVTDVLITVRSDTNTDVDIQYNTDYGVWTDPTPIRTYSWSLVPRNLAMRCLSFNRYAHVARRRPGLRHIRHFSMTFSNNDPGCDLAIVSAQVYYKFQGRER